MLDPVTLITGTAGALGGAAAYAGGRFVAGRRALAALRAPRPWQPPTLHAWLQRGWILPEAAETLPDALAPAQVFYEWARAETASAAGWRLRDRPDADTPFEAVVRDAWSSLPESARPAAEARLREAVREAASWWGGSERGWNGRPLALSAAVVGKKQAGLPLLPLPDLTAAPLPFPGGAGAAAEAEGPDLLLLLAALRHSTPRFVHPLAPRADTQESMIAGLSTQVGSSVGAQVGAGLGAALGPIGAMVGRHLGEIVGRLGGKALADQSLPEPLAAALKETEAALARLGRLVEHEAFRQAVRGPEESILATGRALESVREARSGRLPERVWPSAGLRLTEGCMRHALVELQGYRAAQEHFLKEARSAPAAVAGGMILQNPWLARTLPEGPERLTAARSALNRAALALKRA